MPHWEATEKDIVIAGDRKCRIGDFGQAAAPRIPLQLRFRLLSFFLNPPKNESAPVC